MLILRVADLRMTVSDIGFSKDLFDCKRYLRASITSEAIVTFSIFM
jgi:hypothetical protein